MVIFWFRRDLRLEDNTGLYYALCQNTGVQPIFIFDTNILKKLADANDRRVSFIHRELSCLKRKLNELKGDIWIFDGSPIDIFKQLIDKYDIEGVYVNSDYEPYAVERDTRIESFLNEQGCPLFCFKDQVIFEKEEITKSEKTGGCYKVFTPYSEKWKLCLRREELRENDIMKYVNNLNKVVSKKMIQLEDMGFIKNESYFPEMTLEDKMLANYEYTRDFPSMEKGTSRLSAHLRFGTISIRHLVRRAMHQNQKFLNELIWREFYMMLLSLNPRLTEEPFQRKYKNLEWRRDEDDFERWKQGKTGYPMVDAGMRELNETGYMHNRLRMITAGFLTKHLLIDWKWGEQYFARKLLDFELASNNGGWQWSASIGCDAAPYFRIFNPAAQQEKFDSGRLYIKKWIPEIDDKKKYPSPMVEHSSARERALKFFSSV